MWKGVSIPDLLSIWAVCFYCMMEVKGSSEMLNSGVAEVQERLEVWDKGEGNRKRISRLKGITEKMKSAHQGYNQVVRKTVLCKGVKGV